MTADSWRQAVRQQLGLGRLLALGGPGDGAWITERATVEALTRAAEHGPGIHPDVLRVSPADRLPASPPPSAVRPPASALPAVPLRILAEFRAPAHLPLPDAADRLRRTLFAAAGELLGLRVVEVDVHVTDLLETSETAGGPDFPPTRPPEPGRGRPADPSGAEGSGGVVDALGGAASAVPGVARLSAALASPGAYGPGRASRPVVVEDGPGGRHVLVQVAVTTGHRALEVALAVRAVVASAASGGTRGTVTVAVLVTGVEPVQDTA